jgi:hypothetical protein
MPLQPARDPVSCRDAARSGDHISVLEFPFRTWSKTLVAVNYFVAQVRLTTAFFFTADILCTFYIETFFHYSCSKSHVSRFFHALPHFHRHKLFVTTSNLQDRNPTKPTSLTVPPRPHDNMIYRYALSDFELYAMTVSDKIFGMGRATSQST